MSAATGPGRAEPGQTGRGWAGRLTPGSRRVLYAYAAAAAVLVVGSVLHPGFAAWSSLRVMLVVASFTGFVAAGQMLVVLVGGIDLSIPWVLNAAAIVLTTTSLGQTSRMPLAIAAALGLGALVGCVGVALFVTVLLALTTFGRRVYAVGVNANAAFLAGLPVRGVTIALYGLSGVFAAVAGIALVGYGGQPSLGLGDPYLFASIAAVVVGGVSILGGRGHYAGVVAGALTLVAIITFLQAQRVPEYARSIIYGLVILVILFTYGRDKAHD